MGSQNSKKARSGKRSSKKMRGGNADAQEPTNTPIVSSAPSNGSEGGSSYVPAGADIFSSKSSTFSGGKRLRKKLRGGDASNWAEAVYGKVGTHQNEGGDSNLIAMNKSPNTIVGGKKKNVAVLGGDMYGNPDSKKTKKSGTMKKRRGKTQKRK